MKLNPRSFILTSTVSLFLNYAAYAAQDNTIAPHFDATTGLPTFIWGDSTPQGNSLTAGTTPHEIEQSARRHLHRYSSLYRLNSTTEESAQLEAIHPISESGYIVSFRQEINGIEVFAKHVKVLLNSSLGLTAISGNFAPFSAPTSRRMQNGQFNAPQAIATAFFDLRNENISPEELILTKQQAPYQWYRASGASANYLQPVRIKEIWYPSADGLISAYYLELMVNSPRTAVAYVITQDDGAVLLRKNLRRHTTPFTYRVWADSLTHFPYDSPYGNDALSPVISDITLPIMPVASNAISLTCGPISTCDPWLPDNATKTSGNNARAYADLMPPSGFSAGDIYGAISAPGSFDYSYQFDIADNTQHPEQLQAVITHAFYVVNFMHDWLYDHGFNEISGNGQIDNFRRGGRGNDPIRVEINDYSNTDNAMMTTPADGASATMELYPWTNSANQQLTLNINSKNYSYPVTTANFGPQKFDIPATKIVLVTDTVSPKTDGCETPFVNTANLQGAIALIDRGLCLFAEKVKNAQDAGAIGVLIANNVASNMVQMSGSDNSEFNNKVKIPVFGINQSIGSIIKNSLNRSSVTAEMKLQQSLPYNGALDSTTIIHEWTHFLSDRLITLITNQQGKSMAEGWSDFLALLAIVKESDRNLPGNNLFQAPYGISQYSNSAQLHEYLYGIRRYPYSTDLQKNPLTFKYISNWVALPKSIPVAPYADMTGSENAEEHNSGEVWGMMLWEAYAALLNDNGRLSFSAAQNRMLDYLVASLKFTPNDPTYLEARDALLAVAKNRDLADYRALWRGFAKRGIGINAKGPNRYSQNLTGVIEDYTTP